MGVAVAVGGAEIDTVEEEEDEDDEEECRRGVRDATTISLTSDIIVDGGEGADLDNIHDDSGEEEYDDDHGIDIWDDSSLRGAAGTEGWMDG